jgi:hypothetical protein
MTLFLYTTFSVVFAGGGMSVAGGGKGNLMNVANRHEQNINSATSVKGKSRVFSGFKDKSNLIYLALFLLNVVGYIRVMPK